MKKQVQIPLELLEDIYAILDTIEPFLKGSISEDDTKFIKGVKNEIKAKFERMEKRELFTRYKTAPEGSAERELFRQLYLDEASVHKNFRTEKEINL